MKNRKLLIIAGVVVLVLIVLLAAVPLFVNVDSFRPQLEAQLKSALGRDVKVAKLSLSAFAGHVTAQDVTISDDPAFSKQPFITAKSVAVEASVMKLLTGGGLQVSSITLREPQVTLIHDPGGKWNFSSLGATAAPGAKRSSAPNVSVGELKIKDGTINVVRLGARKKMGTYIDVNVTAKNVSLTSKMSFTVAAKTPGNGEMKVEGTAGPVDRGDAAKTPLDAKVELKHVDIAATGFIDPSSGLAGIVDYTGTVKSDGEKAHSEGKANVSRLKVVRSGQPARSPVSVEYATDLDLEKQTGAFTKGVIHTGKSVARLGGTYDLKPDTPTVRLKLTGQNLPVGDVEGLLPAVGVVLPPGSSLQGGVANANLDLLGPIDRLVTTGTVNVNNTRLANFNIGSRIKSMVAPQTGANTDIQLMSCKLRVAPDGMRTDELTLIMPALGTATGSGTIAANNALNYKLNVKLSANSPLAALVQLGSLTRGGGTLPLTVTGTTSSPVIIPDIGGLITNPFGFGQQAQPGQQGQSGITGALGGLFGKKKK
ncbi:MAG: AsmA family protein [Acidobacteriota bacterium]|nr:AsmA family protein [Acidobacteriota bacterium]